ncbi:MAG TPA: hypothetical protein VHE30_20970 [Polyangiaceae bacterium]|nr:hypothetical protein [Polyangiaceae bacterium]
MTADPLQCGACSRACAADHIAGRVCNAGGCTSSCELGRANCTRPTTGPDDGCELDASGDAKNCGGCSNDCTQQNGKVCQNGLCSCGGDTQCRSGAVQGTATCDTGTGLCACNGTTCRHGESCRQGACACNAGPACTGTQTCCRTPTGCRDLTSDAANCGACGHACTPGFSCSGSACVCEDAGDCNAGTPGTCSGGVCHCGASTCTAGQRCLPNGQCG